MFSLPFGDKVRSVTELMDRKPLKKDGYLSGQVLIAMPTMLDPRFQRTVLYVCAHSSDGAMGLVLNRAFGSITFVELMSQLGIPAGIDTERQVHFGGPVESGRGFVLHTTDFVHNDSMMVDEKVALTGTLDILRAIAEGKGPTQSLFALGYAGWGPGQLDAEIQSNGWLSSSANPALLFDGDIDTKWDRALAEMGIDPLMLSEEAGHA
jgi:putative transcriptional regulator